MAKNTGRGFRKGSVKRRSQVYNPRTGRWTKRDLRTGWFLNAKANKKPFKGVRKED
jgi:hypothetical protein